MRSYCAMLGLFITLGLLRSAASTCTITSLNDISAAAAGAKCPKPGSSYNAYECEVHSAQVMDNLYNLCNEVNWAMIRVSHTISKAPQWNVFYSCSGCPNVWAVYGIWQGTRWCLRNDGERGFNHWRAFGDQRQDDKYFLYYGADRGDCDRGQKVNLAGVNPELPSIELEFNTTNGMDGVRSTFGGETTLMPARTPQECASFTMDGEQAQLGGANSVLQALRVLGLPNNYAAIRRALGPQQMGFVERQICQLGPDNGLVAARRYIVPLLERYAEDKAPDSGVSEEQILDLSQAILNSIGTFARAFRG